MNKITVYLSGPMSGIKDYNFPSFFEAEYVLWSTFGNSPISLYQKSVGLPCTTDNGYCSICMPYYRNHTSNLKIINPALLGVQEGWKWEDYLKVQIPQVISCDVVYVLPGWEKSKGARLEVLVATQLGIPVIDFETFEPIDEEVGIWVDIMTEGEKSYKEFVTGWFDSSFSNLEKKYSRNVTLTDTLGNKLEGELVENKFYCSDPPMKEDNSPYLDELLDRLSGYNPNQYEYSEDDYYVVNKPFTVGPDGDDEVFNLSFPAWETPWFDTRGEEEKKISGFSVKFTSGNTLSMKNGKEESILEEAARLTSTDRQVEYGHPTENFARIAEYWTTHLSNKLEKWRSITPQDVAIMMILLKASREKNTHSRNSCVDIAGYANTLMMLEEDK